MKGHSQTAVVPLLRHQGEMDSCGKDASGNRPAQEMCLAQKLEPFVGTVVWNKPVLSIAYREGFFMPRCKTSPYILLYHKQCCLSP